VISLGRFKSTASSSCWSN